MSAEVVAARDREHDQIPVFKPLLEAEEFEAARAALELGWLGMGSHVARFEEALARLIEAPDRRVAAVSTGHAALHLALMLAEVGPGDEVITPSFNNVADFQAILATGADPVFCDVEDQTLCIDVESASELVTPATKAIIATDYACMLCDHAALAELAEKHRLRVVHDAAHSIGSRYRGRPVGGFSDMTMFSFDPIKAMTSIDGGALIVRSDEELQRVHEMRLIGMAQPADQMYRNRRAGTHDVRRLGFRYHLANLHAAIGVAQLAKLPDIGAASRDTCCRYDEAFAELEQVRTPATDFPEDLVPFLYYVRVPAAQRQGFEPTSPGWVLTLASIGSRDTRSAFRDCRRGDLSITEGVGAEILTLPLHSVRAADTVERVIAGVRSFFAEGE